MVKQRSQLRILFLQIRQDTATRIEEFQEFVRYSRLDPSQISTLNAFDTPDFSPDCVRGYDALFVGGSSDASVLNPIKYPFVENAKALLSDCVDSSLPVLASCFGFQVVVEALGGQVIHDPERMEIGIDPIQLTPAAQEDALFHDVPTGFLAVCGHQERAVKLPANVTWLASTSACPYHALKVEDKPFYGFQFHPEVDQYDLAARITRYQERYLNGDHHLQQVLENLQPTPESHRLIEKFVDRILLNGL